MSQENESKKHFRITFQELDPKPQHMIVEADTYEKAVSKVQEERWDKTKPIMIVGGHEIDPDNEERINENS